MAKEEVLHDYSPQVPRYWICHRSLRTGCCSSCNPNASKRYRYYNRGTSFGFCDRLCVHVHLPRITQLQNEGLSLHQIANELNGRGTKPMIDGPWDVQFVTSILKRNEEIRRVDAYFRMKRQFMR